MRHALALKSSRFWRIAWSPIVQLFAVKVAFVDHLSGYVSTPRRGSPVVIQTTSNLPFWVYRRCTRLSHCKSVLVPPKISFVYCFYQFLVKCLLVDSIWVHLDWRSNTKSVIPPLSFCEEVRRMSSLRDVACSTAFCHAEPCLRISFHCYTQSIDSLYAWLRMHHVPYC